MNYLLVVLTHGHEAHAHLTRSLASFREFVSPAPARVYLHADGDASAEAAQAAVARELRGVPITLEQPFNQRGFCHACSAGWKAATEGALGGVGNGNHTHVFWLEHDFTFARPVDLRELAAVLDGEPDIAQMALMRNAASDEERAAGGLYELRADQYEQRYSCRWCGDRDGNRASWCEAGCGRDYNAMFPWLRHRSYFTTNANLMRRQFMVENPWPNDGLPQCEGRFGIALVKSGYSFGVWGSGEPWTEHFGIRSGFGY